MTPPNQILTPEEVDAIERGILKAIRQVPKNQILDDFIEVIHSYREARKRITELEKTYLPKIGRKRIIWQNGLCEEHFLEDGLLENPVLVRAERDRLRDAERKPG